MCPPGIRAQTNRDTKSRREPSCAANQYAQILYHSHKKTNICANERKYTEGPYSDTQTRKWQGTNRNQPKSRKRRATANYQPPQTYHSIEYEIKIQNISTKTRKDTCHMALEPHRWPGCFQRTQPVTLSGFSYGRWFGVSAIQVFLNDSVLSELRWIQVSLRRLH